jgi:lysophospholipase L1-like esterase
VKRTFCRSLLVALIALSCQPSAALSQDVYVALGDSVAAGAGAATGGGYVERYFEYLRDRAHGGVDRLVNVSRGGETSTGMRTPGGQLDRAVRAIRRRSDTTVVTLDIGGNDGLSGTCQAGFSSNACPFRSNYRAIVSALSAALARDPGRETFQVMDYYNPATGTGTALENTYDLGLLGADRKIDCSRSGTDLGLDDLITCLGADGGAQPVDTYRTFAAAGQPLLTGIHPSGPGHAAIACLFAHPDRAGTASPCTVLTLTGRRTQHPLDQHAVIVSISTDAPSTVLVSARIRIRGARDVQLGHVSTSVPAGTRTTITLRVTGVQARAVRRALRRAHRLPAQVTAVVINAAGRFSYREDRTFQLVG